jgi:hypothetical protein
MNAQEADCPAAHILRRHYLEPGLGE